jgi:hypothetical protein
MAIFIRLFNEKVPNLDFNQIDHLVNLDKSIQNAQLDYDFFHQLGGC